MKLIAGTSNLSLAKSIATYLSLPLGEIAPHRFADDEIFVEILETVRGEDIVLIQSTSHPVNDSLMELLIALNTLKRGGARQVTACIPYFGYARQDQEISPHAAVTAKLVAELITAAGADRVVTVDLHSERAEGFFTIPLHNLTASSLFTQDIKETLVLDSCLVVSPDKGGSGRARQLAQQLTCDFVLIDKQRTASGEPVVTHINGNVQGYNCILIDDIVDSGGTLCKATEALIRAGASSVRAYVTHGVFSNAAMACIHASPLLEVITTDSINLRGNLRKSRKVRRLPLATLLGETLASLQVTQPIFPLSA